MSTTFANFLPVTRISSHEYAVNLEDAWCIGAVPNGGYVTSAFLIVARTHMQGTHKSRSQPDPINLHLEFLRRTSIGKAVFKVTDVKIGSRISNLHITLSQPKDGSKPASTGTDLSNPVQDEVQGYVMMSNIGAEQGPTNVTKYRLSPAALPVSLPALESNSDENYIQRRSDPYGTFRRAGKNMAMYLVRPSKRTPELDNPSILDQWIRFTPQTLPSISPSTSEPSLSLLSDTPASTAHSSGQTPSPPPARWTNDALGYIVDTFPQLHERYINSALEDSLLTHPSTTPQSTILDQARLKREDSNTAKFWYPTLLLNLDVKTKLPPEGVEWLFLRLRAKEMKNGRLDLDIEVWTNPEEGKGELVALSTHAALIVDAGRNIKGRTNNNNNRKKKTDSKI